VTLAILIYCVDDGFADESYGDSNGSKEQRSTASDTIEDEYDKKQVWPSD
jgi:hypothetical protein